MREFDLDEIEELVKLKDETNKFVEIELDEKEIQAAHSLLKKNINHYITSNIQFHTEKSPRSCYVSLRVDHLNDNIIDTVSKLMSCISPPYRIYLDFFCLSKSETRPDFQLIHPSISTSFNNQKIILKSTDKNKLISELSYGNFSEKIIEKHHLTRR